MQTPNDAVSLEGLIDEWRNHLRRSPTQDLDELPEIEKHLRQQISNLVDKGLATDEAFLVVLKRMGSHDALSREFALTHSKLLWPQPLSAPSDSGTPRARGRRDLIVAGCMAVAAGAAIKAPVLFGLQLDGDRDGDIRFYVRNVGLLVLPFLTLYFAWKRRVSTPALGLLGVAFTLAGVFANIYPFARTSSTEVLVALHLPIALWLVVGIAYTGGRWTWMESRMDFIRFSGELFIHYVLIALGGGVLTAFMAMLFQAIEINVEPFIGNWLLPCGAAGAVLIASWLVEAKQSALKNMAPMLTRLFTPMFAIMLILFLAMVIWKGRGIDVTRDVLIAFNLLLVVVIGLLIYSASARDPQSRPNTFDALQVVLVCSALLANAVALWASAARITEFGSTPNRVAALGENLILMVNLAGSAVLYVRFLLGRGTFRSLEKWQTDYLFVFGIWAVAVVVLFPPLFRYQ
jgi:hypothetical protein